MARLPCYNFVLSLQKMASASKAIDLCNKFILEWIAEFDYNIEVDDQKEELINHIRNNLSELKLPKKHNNIMLPILKAVSFEIFRWRVFHKTYLGENSCLPMLKKLHWTPLWTIDYEETAKELVKCDTLKIVKRFELACLYCLEESIPALWEELPEEDKIYFYDGDISQITEPHLSLFLDSIIKREESKFIEHSLFTIDDPVLQNLFECAAFFGHKTLAKYCFKKLTDDEREDSLVRTARYVVIGRSRSYHFEFGVARGRLLSDILCFLLSLMTADEQIKIFRELPLQVLSCFLEWPWEDVFFDILNVIWTFLPESEYDRLFDTIHQNISFNNIYYSNIFPDLFLRLENNRDVLINYFVNYECRWGRFFHIFIKSENAEAIEVIFILISDADRMRIVCSNPSLRTIYTLLEEWPLLEVYLLKALSTREEKEILKNAFMEYMIEINNGRHIEWAEEKFHKFFEFVNT